MAASESQLKRSLRLAFTAGELQALAAEPSFASEIESSDGSPESIQTLIKLGGALLSSQQKSKFRRYASE